MPNLTLHDCLSQRHGIHGRLFESDAPFGEIPSISVYQVIDQDGSTMSVEGYVSGGGKIRYDEVPIEGRGDDQMMSQERLLEWYRVAIVADSQ